MNVSRALRASVCTVGLFVFLAACGVQPDASQGPSSEATAQIVPGPPDRPHHTPPPPPAHHPRPLARHVDARHQHSLGRDESHLVPLNGHQAIINHRTRSGHDDGLGQRSEHAGGHAAGHDH